MLSVTEFKKNIRELRVIIPKQKSYPMRVAFKFNSGYIK